MKVNAPLRSFIWPALAAGAVVIAGGIAIYEHHQISVMQKQFAEEGPISEVAIRAQGRILVWLGAIEPLCEQTLTYYLSAKAKGEQAARWYVNDKPAEVDSSATDFGAHAQCTAPGTPRVNMLYDMTAPHG